MASQGLNSPFLLNVSYRNTDLTVEFKGGKRYRYSNVPPSEYAKMIMSSTPGTYYTQNIKGKYQGKPLMKNQA